VVLWAAWALAGTTLVLSAAILWAMADPDSPAQSMLRLASVEESRAGDILEQKPVTPKRLDAAEAAARRALAQAPTHAMAWLQLAYIDRQRHGRLTPAGLQALQRSYDFEPYGPDVTEWRVLFAFDHWGQLTPELRRQVLREVEARWSVPDNRQHMREWPQAIANPSGRVAALLTLKNLETASASS
jgi:hypothetical protein